jgi:hypothetical protein
LSPEANEIAAGRRVRLPAGAEAPFRVYVNGVERAEGAGADYVVRGNEILFTRAIVKERVSKGRWLAIALGLFGSYGKHEVVDVEYRAGGEVRLAHDVEVLD